MKHFALLAALAATLGSAACAGPVEKACEKSDRASGNTQLCGCIQQVADLTLDGRDQRLAAKFFRDPHRAQEIRQSDRQSDERFWTKYREFGSNAERYCS
ncbi:hypothetical protein SAMN04490244_12032 [Tranquillimonas rosea]|uniref:Arginine transporter n=1 Tax=Tranquillimonas rosea TaxID=641238 RepID=A0A1H9X8I2_9RHOB|nr:hypothetical protein [Tranquillimonas rosea]SES42379.1 hypothetical protein SAMN04490244_12032 [Tranquillimonas rosea]